MWTAEKEKNKKKKYMVFSLCFLPPSMSHTSTQQTYEHAP